MRQVNMCIFLSVRGCVGVWSYGPYSSVQERPKVYKRYEILMEIFPVFAEQKEFILDRLNNNFFESNVILILINLVKNYPVVLFF